MKAGMLTGGGDCPALNAVIRAVTFKLENQGASVVGFLDGWAGVLENRAMPLTRSNTARILHLGGTVIGTSRTNPFKKPDQDVPRLLATLREQKLDALIAVGGDDTLGVATRLFHEHHVNVVGVPKTIDNDLSSTDFTFGFDSSVNVAMEAIDRLHTTADAHHRCIVVECMGRHAGWITTFAGLAGYADYILIPERVTNTDQLCARIKQAKQRGQKYFIIAVAEGAKLDAGALVAKATGVDAFGHERLGGVAEQLAGIIEKGTGVETRHVVLGHIQRGGSPSAFDRVLGTRYGHRAAELVLCGKFGRMVALRGFDIVDVDLKEATGETKKVPMDFFAVAEEFFI
ncbi:MAG: ATP-dependent 6-phosphofructokinase [Planctomycetota bacterium]